MQCPVCSGTMVEKDFGGVAVDVCENGCKSIWFDHLELVKLDEPDEGLGAAIESALKHPRVNNELRSAVKCPKCGIHMQIHQYKRSKEVNVDECYSCGGFLLDSGELKEIRDTYMSDAECADYQKKLISSVPSYATRENKIESMENRHDAIAAFTGLLSKKYWGFPF